MSEERWLPVVGYEGLYEVSDCGRVRVLDRMVSRHHTGPYLKRGHLLTPQPIRGPRQCGHLKVVLYKGAVLKTHQIHRAVLEAFVGPCPSGMECRHLDGDARNNLLENLRWGTPRENREDQHRHGTSNRGERNRWSSLTAEQVREIRRLRGEGIYQKDVAKLFGVTRKAIHAIDRGKTWGWLP